MMIELSDGCFVSADFIAELKANRHINAINIKMKDGTGHIHEPKYGETLDDTAIQLAEKINHAIGR